MAIKTTSFRLPSKYLVFLEALAAERSTKFQKVNRTDVLIGLLDSAMSLYLQGKRAQ